MEESLETVVQPVAPVELPELVYEYQPKDEKGRKLGGKQVIKYRTQEELVQKLEEQNINLVRALREQTRKYKLGAPDTNDSVPDDALKFESFMLTPRDLSPDEKVTLSRDLLDPERSEQAIDTILEVRLGAKPKELSEKFNELNFKMQGLVANLEADAFMASTPEYYACRENFDAITGWMLKKDLAPHRQNFKLAFDTLRKEGVMLSNPDELIAPPVERPTVETNPTPVDVLPPQPIVEAPSQRITPPATGLRDSSGTPPLEPKYKMSLQDINKMPAEQYKKKLHDPNFVKMVNDLEAEAIQKSRNN